jgi:1,4-dihydroxy-2-naphthoate octaprenyltransferase
MKNKTIGYVLAIAALTAFYIVPSTSGFNVLIGLVCMFAGIYYTCKSERILGTILLLISLMVNIVFNWYTS